MIFVGIDWSSSHNDVCILNERGEKIKEFRINVNATGFEYLLQQIGDAECGKKDAVVGIETDKNIVSDFLLSHGYTVYSLNPLKVNRFKERYNVAAKKNDAFDAETIARFLYKDMEYFKPVIQSEALCEEISQRCATLDMLIRQRTREINRLRAVLNSYFPAFSSFFSNLSTSIPGNVLKIIGSPSEFAQLTEEEYYDGMKAVKRITTTRKARLFEYLKTEIIVFKSPKEKSLHDKACLLADQILRFGADISRLEKEISRLFKEHEMAPVFASLPAAGTRLAPRLLAMFGDNRERFDSYQSVQCYAGTAPVTASSGKSFYSVKMRRACKKKFRNAAYQYAFCSLQHEPWAYSYYQGLKARGKSHSAALRALANKWLKIIFRMWKDGKPYDRTIFVGKREKLMAAVA